MENSLNSKEIRSDKKPYVKPLIEKVTLKPEEAVLAGGCKSGIDFMPGYTGCTNFTGSCFADGS